MVGDRRETAGTTMCLTVRYVREKAGDEGVARLLELAGETRTAGELEDEHRWSTYEQKISLWEAAATLLGDPMVSRHIGESALRHRVGAGLRVLLRTLGSPGLVLSNVAKACAKFSTVASMEALDVERGRAVVTYTLHPDKAPHRLDCECNIGLISVIGPLFGMPPLEVEHPECQVEGAPACRYIVTWDERSRRRRRRTERDRQTVLHLEEQLSAVTAQLESLQSTAADLVSSDDLDEVLARIVTRAGVAVSAPRFLLAVRTPHDGQLRIHADGFATDDAAEAAGRALLHAPLGTRVTNRIVIDVASSRHVYGRLAAIYDEHTFFAEERALLAAYARNAAAALDAATALEEARRRGATASALLELARALAEVSTGGAVAQKLAEAMPAVVGAHAAVVLVWDEARRALVVQGKHGWPETISARLDTLSLRADTSAVVDELVGSPAPRFAATTGIRDPLLRSAVERLAVDAVASVPIVQQGELLGLAVAGFHEHEIPALLPPVLERMSAIADQAATALQNGRLLDRISHEAMHDSLTGLANRTMFEERVTRALARAQRDGTRPALLFVDLDRFKRVNDSLGHEQGDRLLREVSTRLAGVLRAGDEVARVGGDEFAILLHDVDRTRALHLGERVRHALSEPVALDGEQQVVVSASVGISVYPDDGETYDELLRRADLAMYDAKAHGRDLCRAYHPGSVTLGGSALELERDLRRALLGDELTLAFQPEVDLHTDRIVAVEALVRWEHPVLGLLLPGRFLPAAEAGGLSLALDVWALRTACRHAQSWRERGHQVRVAVNVAPSSCARTELVDAVAVALRESGLDPTALELEITENAALDAYEDVVAVLGGIREMGVTLTLDDFGVGYSLFGRLRDFSIGRVKIDRSFVSGDGDGESIIAAITAMSHGLGVEVVAEGVETHEQLAMVRRQGCEAAQGFLLARPAPPGAVAALLGARLASAAEATGIA